MQAFENNTSPKRKPLLCTILEAEGAITADQATRALKEWTLRREHNRRDRKSTRLNSSHT